jgi:hypothetical protein
MKKAVLPKLRLFAGERSMLAIRNDGGASLLDEASAAPHSMGNIGRAPGRGLSLRRK